MSQSTPIISMKTVVVMDLELRNWEAGDFTEWIACIGDFAFQVPIHERLFLSFRGQCNEQKRPFGSGHSYATTCRVVED